MLKPLQASTRAISRCRWPTFIQWNRSPTLGLLGHQGLSSECDERNKKLFTSVSTRRQETVATVEPVTVTPDAPQLVIESHERVKKLPLVCPGCGAPSQTVDQESAGFYGSKRASKANQRSTIRLEEDEIFNNALKSGALSEGMEAGEVETFQLGQTPQIPICDRCHYLLYQSRGTSIIHPSMQSIQDIIEESPHKHNHIYHVLDAADFPMSLIPNLANDLDLPRLRTQNRRSKSMHYAHGRHAEVSFIITRSDLLAPQKEQVDSLVPYLKEVLRDALGRSGKNIRLGNVRCVSAKRGWWTKTVKEDIWNRGGAGWMVGKVNVGKSALYEVVFPKGRNEQDTDVARMRKEEQQTLQKGLDMLNSRDDEFDDALSKVDTGRSSTFADSPGDLSEAQETLNTVARSHQPVQESKVDFNEQNQRESEETTFFDENDDASLLPPAQPETAYPHMPLVSALPGTTASPIRIPFGNGKGELIDLPGIHRSSLDTHIRPEHHKELVMKSRVVPEQYTIKPGQSILIGGVIRITPKNDELIFLAYPFVPLEAHVTSHDKAIAIQTGVDQDGELYAGTIETIATEGAKQRIKSAGTFQLEWDVTKRRAGPLTDRAAGKQKAANLPFIVYSADILIESVGWVELTCQVRSRQRSFITEAVTDAFGTGTVKREAMPEVEIFTPNGEFVSVRRPMNAWLLGGPKKVPKHARHARPRQSISMTKRKAGGAKLKGVSEA